MKEQVASKNQNEQKKHKIFLLEDHFETSEWLQSLLLEITRNAEILHAESFEEAKKLLPMHHFDYSFVDLQLPDAPGTDIIRLIKSKYPKTSCVVITSYDDDKYLFPAVRAGAAGYLLKSEDREDIKHRIQAIFRGDISFSPGVMKKMLAYFESERISLTDDEREVLLLKSQGYTRKPTAKRLRKSENAIANVERRLFVKLNVHTMAEASCRAEKLGLLSESFENDY